MSAIKLEIRNADVAFENDDGIDKIVNIDVVTGVKLSTKKPISIAQLHPEIDYKEPMALELAFPDTISERLAIFYRRYFAKPPEEEYDCHSMIAYVKKWSVSVEPLGMTALKHQFGQHPVSTYHPGAVYTLIDKRDGLGSHSIMGIDGTDKNMSIIGVNGPLIITDHATITDLYGADRVVNMWLDQPDVI